MFRLNSNMAQVLAQLLFLLLSMADCDSLAAETNFARVTIELKNPTDTWQKIVTECWKQAYFDTLCISAIKQSVKFLHAGAEVFCNQRTLVEESGNKTVVDIVLVHNHNNHPRCYAQKFLENMDCGARPRLKVKSDVLNDRKEIAESGKITRAYSIRYYRYNIPSLRDALKTVYTSSTQNEKLGISVVIHTHFVYVCIAFRHNRDVTKNEIKADLNIMADKFRATRVQVDPYHIGFLKGFDKNICENDVTNTETNFARATLELAQPREYLWEHIVTECWKGTYEDHLCIPTDRKIRDMLPNGDGVFCEQRTEGNGTDEKKLIDIIFRHTVGNHEECYVHKFLRSLDCGATPRLKVNVELLNKTSVATPTSVTRAYVIKFNNADILTMDGVLQKISESTTGNTRIGQFVVIEGRNIDVNMAFSQEPHVLRSDILVDLGDMQTRLGADHVEVSYYGKEWLSGFDENICVHENIETNFAMATIQLKQETGNTWNNFLQTCWKQNLEEVCNKFQGRVREMLRSRNEVFCNVNHKTGSPTELESINIIFEHTNDNLPECYAQKFLEKLDCGATPKLEVDVEILNEKQLAGNLALVTRAYSIVFHGNTALSIPDVFQKISDFTFGNERLGQVVKNLDDYRISLDMVFRHQSNVLPNNILYDVKGLATELNIEPDLEVSYYRKGILNGFAEKICVHKDIETKFAKATFAPKNSSENPWTDIVRNCWNETYEAKLCNTVEKLVLEILPKGKKILCEQDGNTINIIFGHSNGTDVDCYKEQIRTKLGCEAFSQLNFQVAFSHQHLPDVQSPLITRAYLIRFTGTISSTKQEIMNEISRFSPRNQLLGQYVEIHPGRIIMYMAFVHEDDVYPSNILNDLNNLKSDLRMNTIHVDYIRKSYLNGFTKEMCLAKVKVPTEKRKISTVKTMTTETEPKVPGKKSKKPTKEIKIIVEKHKADDSPPHPPSAMMVTMISLVSFYIFLH